MQRHDLRTESPVLYAHDLGSVDGHPTVIGLISDDLPCPWCGEATSETDHSCHGCGRRFG
jgi:hypothetical protein